MDVGMVFPARHPIGAAELIVGRAEAWGLDSLWTVDHLLGTQHPGLVPESSADPDGFFDPFCLISRLSAGSRLPFGTCVTDAVRRGGADLARTALTLQQLCPGGFRLGIGSGEAENLLPFGYDFRRPVARTEAVLGELRSLLDNGTMPGSLGRTGLPRRSAGGAPQIWLAAHGPRMLDLAGRYADGWLPAFISDPEEYAAKLAAIGRAARSAGRPTPVAAMQPFVILGESTEAVAERFEAEPASKLFALWFGADAWAAHGLSHPCGPQARGFQDVIVHALDTAVLRELAPRIPFTLLADHICIGNVDEIVERLAPFARAGVEHVVLGSLTGLVGGADEFAARLPEIPRLVAALKCL